MYEQKLVRGASIHTRTDVIDGNSVMLVNQTFANQLKPDGSAVGMRFTSDGRESTIVIGVVEDINMPGKSVVPIRVYTPTSAYLMDMTLRVEPNHSLSRQQVVEIVASSTAHYALFSYEPLITSKRKLLFTQYVTVFITFSVALVTLLLVGIGLYGILSYSTQIRRFEIGTRLAIGAKRWDIVKLIVKDNASTILLGILSSVLILLVLYLVFNDSLTAYLNSYTSDYLIYSFVMTVGSISLLSLFACYWPLRKYINQPAIHSLRGSD